MTSTAAPFSTGRYQQIALKDGRVLPGQDRSQDLERVFGEGVAGQSLLDIGTFHGLFCLEAMRRGASRALGLEAYRESVDVARHLAAQEGLGCEYIETDFEEWESDEEFDIVLCLNVMHHMFDPIHALHRMMRMARRKLFLEIAPPSIRDVARGNINPVTIIPSMWPVIAMGHPRRTANVAGGTFLFTPAAIEVLLNQHTHIFEPIKIMKTRFKGRFMVEARKRRIRHLTVLAGPTSSGKSTFCDRLLSDRGLAERLGLPTTKPVQVSGHNAGKLAGGEQEHVLMHYNILRPFARSMRAHSRDPALSLFACADRITLITISTPAKRLQAQLQANEIDRPLIADSRHKKLLKHYGEPDFLRRWYGSWFDYCARYSGSVVEHTIVENDGTYSYHPLDAFQELYGRHNPSPA